MFQFTRISAIPFLLGILITFQIILSDTANPPTPNFTNVMVWFDPFASVEDIIYLQTYSEAELFPLVEHAVTRFSRLMVPIYPRGSWSEKRFYSSLELVPRIAAKLNIDRHQKLTPKSNPKPIQIWLVHMIPSTTWKDSDGKILNRLKEISDNANSIYEGTVQVILEYYNFPSPPKSGLTGMERISILKQNGYAYGLVLPLDMCTAPGDNLIKEISKNLDILMFSHSPTNLEVEEGKMARSTAGVINNFEVCKTTCVREFISAPSMTQLIKVGFLTEWPDTSVNGTVNYANLVSYWSTMSNWALSSGTPLILRNAFDTPYEERMASITRGWWRLTEEFENGKSQLSPKIRFLEKTGLPSDSEEMKKLSRNLTWLSQDTHLSRDHIILRFDPFISDGKVDKWAPGPNDDTHLANFFQHVSTKISKVIIVELNLFPGDRRLELIPGVVSRYKRFNGEPKDGSAPYEMIMTMWEMDDWELTKSVADKANVQSPGTVTTLLIQNEDERFSPERMQELKTFFQYARDNSKIRGNGRYKIAGMFISEKCFIPEDTQEFVEEVAPLVPYLDQIFFMELFSPSFGTGEMCKLGVKRLVDQTTTRFQYCKNKILRVAAASSVNIEVGFLTGWSDTNHQGQQSYAGQVKFWEMMNDWAVSSNTKIMFIEAFDQARKKVGGHLGWWSLQPNKTYQSPSEFVFEDKRALALQAVVGIPGRQTPSSSLGPLTIVGIIVVVLLVIALIFLSALLIRRRRQDDKRLYLTQQEIHNFFNGIKEEIKLELRGRGSQNDISNRQCGRPYNKERYELLQSSFVVDEKTVLGSGEFGKVCRGTVKLQHFEDEDNAKLTSVEERIVAVKMANTNSSDMKRALTGLLSEIKILSYLGMHENIVSLIGAYTASLSKDNRVYLFLELCEEGALEKYLRKWDIAKVQKMKMRLGMAGGSGRVSYLNTSLNDEGYMRISEPGRGDVLSVYDNVDEVMPDPTPTPQVYLNMEKETTLVDISKDLHRWVKEIVNGMEFLASKNVLHADLATRNILLAGDKRTAKISDFGLSRRMYEYTNYVKSKQEPLPWRWLSPESLSKLVFNEKTDVWSFGVTIWEIFTCGEIPYPGLSWDVEFCNRLEEGLKMGKPLYCDHWMYEIMLKCWQVEPENRPTFAELKDILCD